jgi:hypothetical protein
LIGIQGGRGNQKLTLLVKSETEGTPNKAGAQLNQSLKGDGRFPEDLNLSTAHHSSVSRLSLPVIAGACPSPEYPVAIVLAEPKRAAIVEWFA